MADPPACPPDGGCGGCGNWPEHCVCESTSPAMTDGEFDVWLREHLNKTRQHHPRCYQNAGVPGDLPADLCDCRVLRMIEHATPPASDGSFVASDYDDAEVHDA